MAHGVSKVHMEHLQQGFWNAQVLEIVDIGHLKKKGVVWCQGSHSRHSRAECTRRRRSLKWSHRHRPPRKSGVHSTVCQTPMGTAECVITKEICCGSFLSSRPLRSGRRWNLVSPGSFHRIPASWRSEQHKHRFGAPATKASWFYLKKNGEKETITAANLIFPIKLATNWWLNPPIFKQTLLII